MVQSDSCTGAGVRRVVLGLAIASGLLGLTFCHAPVGPRGSPGGTPRSESASSASVNPVRPDRQRDEGEDGSRALPVFMIDFGDGQVAGDAKTPGVLRVIEDHDGSLADLGSREISMESGVALELHGDSSARLAKPSYQLELVDDDQTDRDLPLLGLPPGSDWVLHSCGYDPSCLRNVLIYALARDMGHYSPRTRFLELFVNDRYQGLYVLIERVRRDKNRVNLPSPSKTAWTGDLTGGYILKLDLGEGTRADQVPRDWVSPVSGSVYSYHYPRFDRITSAQKAYLQDHMSRFEALMQSPKWNDADVGYRRWLHLPSWLDFALLQELSLNPDAYFKSVYLQKWPRSMGDLIAIGPVWDFDIALGVVDFRNGRNVQSWAHDMNRFGGQPVPYDPPGTAPYVPEYWERLWSDSAFQDRLRCRWQELRGTTLTSGRLETMIDDWHDEVAGALARDWALWSMLPKNSYHGADVTLKEFLRKRLAWMDVNLPGRCSA